MFQIGMAYTLLTRGVRHVTALDASLLLLAEPVLNPVWAWMIHGERPTSWALAGGAVILSASVSRTMMARDYCGIARVPRSCWAASPIPA